MDFRNTLILLQFVFLESRARLAALLHVIFLNYSRRLHAGDPAADYKGLISDPK